MCDGAFPALIMKNVPQILEAIFFSLDYESYKTCQRVSAAWNGLLKSATFQKRAKSVFRDGIQDDEKNLMNASLKGKADEVIRLLSTGLVNVNCLVEWYPGSTSHSTPLYEAAENGQLRVVKILLEAGADPSKVNEWGRSPLHPSARSGHTNVVQELLDRGAEFDGATKDGLTPLHEAVMGNRKDIVKLLLDKGADPNKEDKWKNTSLLHAVFWGHKEIIPLLLARGADPRHEDRTGTTPLSYALEYEEELVKDLVHVW